MTHDPELDAWRSQWQSREDGVPLQLRKRVERELRARRYEWLVPIAVTVLFGGGTLTWALASGERMMIQLAMATWAFIVITWITSLSLSKRIGYRRIPETATMSAFLDYTVRVCRAKRAGIAAAAALSAPFVAFMLTWRYRTGSFASIGEYVLSARVLAIAVIALLLAVAAWRRYRRLGRELDSLLAVQRQLQDRND